MDRVVLVTRPTRLDALVARFNTRQQAKFYIEHIDGDFGDYEEEHERYYRGLALLEAGIAARVRCQRLDWKYLPNFAFDGNSLVVTYGQDGLIANTLKYIGRQPILGVNPDRGRWDGVLAQFGVEGIGRDLEDAFEGRARTREVTKALIRLSDRQELSAVNDFFVGVKNHSSARYRISVDGESEYQSSSGIIVSTPLGRSGWMKSVMAGATGITSRLSERTLAVRSANDGEWGSDRLVFAVREPFPSVNTKTRLVFGTITERTRFMIESKMGENGIVFSDGIQEDYLDFNYSITATVSIAEEKGLIVVKRQAG